MQRNTTILDTVSTLHNEQLETNKNMELNKVTEMEHDKLPDAIDNEEAKNEVHMAIAKMMEEKHTYTYKKLVVPMSMRSVYWKFFGFPATDDGDILTKVKIVCILCKTQIAYNRNTSNLRMHLQNKHTQELVELESTKPPKKQYVPHDAKERRIQKKLLKTAISPAQHIYTTNIDGTVEIDGDIQFVTDPNISLSNLDEDMALDQPLRVTIKSGNGSSSSKDHISYVAAEEHASSLSIDGRTVSDAIAEFIIIDLQLPEIVEGRGFQRLIATLSSPCEMPTKDRLEEDIIPRMYEVFRESVNGTLGCISGEFGLTIEEWQSYNQEKFVTFSVCYQNSGESSLEMKVLSTIHAPLDWCETQWGQAIDTLLLEWELRPERITAVILATARVELQSVLDDRGLIAIPCLLHTLHLCAKTCFENSVVAGALSKCRAVVGAIMENSTIAEHLSVQEQLNELDDGSLSMDYPPVWTSTSNMLEQLYQRRNIISTILENIEGIHTENYDLSEEQWKIVEDVLSVLQPLKVAVMTLNDVKMPIISLMKPLLWHLVSSHIKPQDTDSDLARSLKESVSELLVERYANSAVSQLLQIATTLDPRFKQLACTTTEDKVLASEPIKDMLTKLIQEEGFEQVDIKIEEEPPNKKSRLSGMELLLGNLCSPKNEMRPDEKANLEIIQYQSEPTAPLNVCPLQWWAKNSAKCPYLSRLAQRYHCAPACATPSTRIPAQLQIDFETKRSTLPPHLVDKLLFLHGNHTV